MVLTSSESDQYSSTQKEISTIALQYLIGYFCRSVYKVFVILVFSCFGFEGSILVMIAKVPGHCLLVAFNYE